MNGYYWWYGSSANRYNVVQTYDASGHTGVWLYKSTDLLNWQIVGNILPVASGWSYVLEPTVLFNAANNNYVLWAHGYNIPASSSDRGAIATATAPDGP